MVDQRWANLYHPLVQRWTQWLYWPHVVVAGRCNVGLSLAGVQCWPTIEIRGWSNVILSGRLPTLDRRMCKGWANVGSPFYFCHRWSNIASTGQNDVGPTTVYNFGSSSLCYLALFLLFWNRNRGVLVYIHSLDTLTFWIMVKCRLLTNQRRSFFFCQVQSYCDLPDGDIPWLWSRR